MAAQMKKAVCGWGSTNSLVPDVVEVSIAQVPAKGKVIL